MPTILPHNFSRTDDFATTRYQSSCAYISPTSIRSLIFFFLWIRRPPRSPLFPSTPLSRSLHVERTALAAAASRGRRGARDLSRRADLCDRPRRHRSGVHGRADLRRPRRPQLPAERAGGARSEEHTSELQSPCNLVCRLLLE